MNCERAKELFSDYLEGGVDSAVSAVLRAHVNQCASCRHEYEVFKQAYNLLGTLPEIEPPASFRHDVVMRMARAQHAENHSTRQERRYLDGLLSRLIPLRAVAIACAGAALAIILLRVPQTAYEQVAGMFVPKGHEVKDAYRPTNAIQASPLLMESERKQEWQSRKLSRNTVWATVSKKENGSGSNVYRVKLSINTDALLPEDYTQRIGAKVYLLPMNRFDFDAIQSAEPEWEGNILADQPVVVPVMPVIYDQSQGGSGSVNLLVTWSFRHRTFASIIYIPTQCMSSRDVFDISVNNGGFSRGGNDMYAFLQGIAQEYGTPIIANALLENRLSAVGFGRDSLVDELMQTLKPAGLDWLAADGAIYVDRKYEVR